MLLVGFCLLDALSVSAQTIQTVTGGGTNLYVNIPALSVSLSQPQAVAYAPDGTIYIAHSNVVEHFNPATGLVTTVAGNGNQGYSGDGGLATSAELDSPSGVAADALGNLYIADYGNDVVRMVSGATGVISTVAGTGGFGFSGDGGPAVNATLYEPWAVAVDPHGNLYIADAGNRRIRVVTAGSGIITTVAGNGTVGYTGDGGPAAAAELGTIYGLAFDSSGNLYLADAGYGVIRMVATSSGAISTVAGQANPSGGGYSGDGGPATNAELGAPYGVAVDSAGNIYIADWANEAIRMVTAASGTISSLVGAGQTILGYNSGGFSGDGGPAANATISSPYGIAVDGAGDVYIADFDNHRVRMITAATRIISTAVGEGTEVGSGDGRRATSAVLADPSDVAVDGYGNLYIADPSDSVVRKVTAATGVISTVAGSGVWEGDPDLGDGGAANAASLWSPLGVAVDGFGNLYIADNLDDRVRMVTATTGVMSTMAGNGSQYASGDGGPATSAGISPWGVAVDRVGNVYIADGSNNRIRMVAPSTGVITTVAGNGCAGGKNHCTAYAGDGGPATSAALNFPESVAVDSSENVFIADTNNNVVRLVTAATGIITTVAGTGSAGYAGDGGPATSAQLNHPDKLALDSSGNLYVADTGNNVIRMVAGTTGLISTVAGNGSQGYSGDGGPATSAELNTPYGIAVSSGGSLYVADSANAVIRQVTGLVSTSPPLLTPTVTGTLGNNGWYTSNIQVSWTVSGGRSPIISQSGCGTVTISTDTSGQTLTCNATSAGGTTTQSVTIKRDATPPTITITAPPSGATYTIGSTIAAAYTCADTLSGPASCTGAVASGSPVNTMGTGSHTFMVSATDQAGNASQASIGYTVALASQSITFGAIASQTAGNTLALQASSSSGLPVTFNSSTPGVCAVSESTATLLAAGPCTITASQGGNGSYLAAKSVSQSFTVTAKLIDTVTLGIASGTQAYSVRNTFSIGPSYKGSPVPTGTVTLYDNGVALVTVPLGATGVALYTANPLNVGVNVMTASYSGDSHYAAGVSAPVTLTVTPAPVKLIATCYGGTPYNVAYQCVATVGANTATPPTGDVTYSLDGASVTSLALSSGTVSFAIAPPPAAGAHKLTIAYAAQGNYAAGTTLTESFTTAPGQTQLLISPSSYYIAAGSRITLTVTASTPQSGVPTGTVTVYDNGKALGAATIGSKGVATYTVASIPKGTNTYTAKYAATADYAAAASGSAAVTAY